MKTVTFCAAIAAATAVFTGTAQAEDYFAGKTMTLYVGFGPGGRL